jgi:hypothetical protein
MLFHAPSSCCKTSVWLQEGFLPKHEISHDRWERQNKHLFPTIPSVLFKHKHAQMSRKNLKNIETWVTLLVYP